MSFLGRALALQGVGYPGRVLALQGVVSSVRVDAPRRHGSGGRLVGLHFRQARPDADRRARRRNEEFLLLVKP
ncbi:hypothetical protein HNQ51_001762 [Inhella inkyongensis]|uniref:Uncharacterized protein n=1 Tax=Inhella inkyongensis TaxID=392593 RepID=A0A840S4Q5_9BURK|nr:hypothetical protein [Inhella inkyongensis]